MLALAQGDRARAQRIARTPPPGVDPDGTGLPLRPLRGARLALERRAAAAAARRCHVARSRETGPTAAWSRPSCTRCGESRRSRGPMRIPARLAYEETLRTAPDDGTKHALMGLPWPSWAGWTMPSARASVGWSSSRSAGRLLRALRSAPARPGPHDGGNIRQGGRAAQAAGRGAQQPVPRLAAGGSDLRSAAEAPPVPEADRAKQHIRLRKPGALTGGLNPARR